jgi:hypothetical protein
MMKVERTSEGLRRVLFDEIDALRGGKSSATRANALSTLAGSVFESVRLELEVHKLQARGVKHVGELSADGLLTLNKPLSLASPGTNGHAKTKRLPKNRRTQKGHAKQAGNLSKRPAQ